MVAEDVTDSSMSRVQKDALQCSVMAAQRTGLAPLRHVSSTGSTNSDLAVEARQGFCGACVLVADHQTAGRGRLGRRWLDADESSLRSRNKSVANVEDAGSGKPVASTGDADSDESDADSEDIGSLLVSFRLPSPLDKASELTVAVSAAALAVVKTLLVCEPVGDGRVGSESEQNKRNKDLPLRKFAGNSGVTGVTNSGVSGVTVMAKWPNDLVVESSAISGKLAGVLAEAVDGPSPVVVVGLGLNISAIPEEPTAVGLNELRVEVTRDELLSRILYALPRYLADPSSGYGLLRSNSATIGSTVRVEYVDGTIVVGKACDIDSKGRLIVNTVDGPRKVETADVHHLRPADRVRDQWVRG